MLFYIENKSFDPHYNLALEEFVLKSLDSEEDCIMLWQNKPAVIVGRFQNTVEEINNDYIKEHKIPVVRRLTGGGAVYHDLGNLNFTFIEKTDNQNISFVKYGLRIVDALQKMGVNAEVSGRNDITIDGKKFSGNAQYLYRGKVLHHGTLLFNANLGDVQKALHVSTDKIESKGIKSVRSRVTNIQDYLGTKITLQQFKERLLESLFAGRPFVERRLSEEELAEVNRLTREKYATWEWNYGNSPAFNLRVKGRFSCGGIEVLLSVEKGLIQTCKIYGDFFSNRDISELEEKLTGVNYKEDAVEAVLSQEDISQHFGNMQKEEFIKLLFSV